MISLAGLPEPVAKVFRSVWGPLAVYAHPSLVDLKSRRLSNATDAVQPQDLVTLAQVQALLGAAPASETAVGASTPGVRVGAYTARGSARQFRGQLFAATDRNYVAWVSDGATWFYLLGTQRGTIVVDQKPTLTTADAGYLFHATDFDRVYRWSGSAWADAPGQPRRGMLAHFEDAPGTGWAACDGSTVTASTGTGGTASKGLPSLNGDNRFLRGATSAGGTGGSATTHTHQVDPPSTNTGGPSGTTDVQSGAGATVASSGHGHSTDIATFASAGPSGTAGDDALPPYYNAPIYYRL